MQCEGIIFFETFLPVAKATTIKLVVAFATTKK